MSVSKETEVLRAACCVAGLDEQIGEKEQQLLENIAEHIGVGRASLKAMMDRARTDPDFYRQLFDFIRANPKRTMQVLLAVAMADGELQPRECEILDNFADRLGMAPAEFQGLLATAKQKVQQQGRQQQ